MYKYLFCLFFFLPLTLAAQEVKVTTLREEQGLANNFTKAIIQDQNGFVWIGSDHDLLRYDGKHFKSYKINFHYVKSFFKRKNGRLFAIHDDGITEIINRSDTVILPTLLPFKNEFTDSTVHYPKSIYEDITGNLWISEPVSVVKYKNRKLKRYVFDSKNATSSFLRSFSFAEDHNNVLYVASQQGYIYYYDKILDEFREIKLPFAVSSINTISHVGNGRIWICSSEGITEMTFNIRSGITTFRSIVTQPREVSGIQKDASGNFYIGTWNDGVYRLSYNKDSSRVVAKIDQLNFKTINSLSITNQDQILISSDNGIAFIEKKSFDKLGVPSSREYFHSIVKGENGIIYMTDGSYVFELRENNGKLQTKPLLQAIDEDFLSLRWSDNSLWVGTNKGKLRRFKNGKVVKTIDITKYSIGTSVFYLSSDTSRNIWLCHDADDVIRVTPGYQVDVFNQQKGIRSKVLVIKQLGDGQILCGGTGKENSLYRYNPQKDYFENITPRFTEAVGQDFAINDLCMDQQGGIWLATNYGLYLLKGSKLVKQILVNVQDNKEIKAIHSIETATDKGLWIGTAVGLVRFYGPEDYLVYDNTSGLPAKTLSFRSLVLDEQGGVFAGTVNGVAYSFSTPHTRNTVKPVFISLRVNDDEVQFKEDSLYSFNGYSFLQAEVIALSFQGDNVYYQYRLLGKNSNWSDPARNSEITIPHLKDGDYILEVRALNQGGFYWSEPVKFRFSINKPFYLSWYAIVFYIVFLGLLLLLAIKLYTYRLIKEKQRLEEIVSERTAQIIGQKEEIEQQKNFIEDKSIKLEMAYEDIRESMLYAKNIQEAMLKNIKYAYHHFDDLFVLFIPRDIVSGDFYWYANKDNKVIIAAVDCTGHGVPGALMSMAGNATLNNIVNEKGITSPDLILNELNKGIKSFLKKDKNESKDGMDIALCTIDKKNNTLEYAGAINPLYLIQKGELTQVKGSPYSIGDNLHGEEVSFAKHTFDLSTTTTFYIFSDGFHDQTGGPDNMKFMKKNFRDLLLKIHQRPMSEQKKILEETLIAWKGDREQIDDILIIGGRL